jgi:hypothetical protein
MPLAGTQRDGELDLRRKAIGFWMFVEPIEVRPFRPVRVFVTFEVLAQLDRTQPNNPVGALEIFSSHRATIEAAASARFDAKGMDEGDFGGKPIVTVQSDDLKTE